MMCDIVYFYEILSLISSWFFWFLDYDYTLGNCEAPTDGSTKVSESKEFNDGNCRARCSRDSSCTAYSFLGYGYTLNGKDTNVCKTFTSIGASGNGDRCCKCYSKSRYQGNFSSIDNSVISQNIPINI